MVVVRVGVRTFAPNMPGMCMYIDGHTLRTESVFQNENSNTQNTSKNQEFYVLSVHLEQSWLDLLDLQAENYTHLEHTFFQKHTREGSLAFATE